jgi:hypothetical protein
VEEQKMAKGKEHNNRLWWMASVAVLLFVALAVGPVAAYDVIPYPLNNHTYIPMANPPIKYDSTYLGDPYYYVNLTNTTGGMNAIHIADSYAPANAKGACYTGNLNGTFYVTDTGGKGGEDDIILLIGVNSIYNDTEEIDSISINITASGYTWTPNSSGSPPSSVNYEIPLSAKPFNVGNYLENATYGDPDLYQGWKFAPTADYPIYCGQDMSASKNFKLIAVDTKVGTINGTWYNETYDPDVALENNGFTKITYNITNPEEGLSSGSIIAFNVYAYNNKTITQKKGDSLPPAINWLNLVKTSAQSSWTNASGWMITI